MKTETTANVRLRELNFLSSDIQNLIDEASMKDKEFHNHDLIMIENFLMEAKRRLETVLK